MSATASRTSTANQTGTPSSSVTGSGSQTGTPTPSSTRTPTGTPTPTVTPWRATTFSFEEGSGVAPFVASPAALVRVVSSELHAVPGRSYTVSPPEDGGSYMVSLTAGAAGVPTTLSLSLETPAEVAVSFDAYFASRDFRNDSAQVAAVETDAAGQVTTTVLYSVSVAQVGTFGRSGWIRRSADLPPAASVVLRLSVINAGGMSTGNSSLLVDNVAVCALNHDFIPDPSPTPSATPRFSACLLLG